MTSHSHVQELNIKTLSLNFPFTHHPRYWENSKLCWNYLSCGYTFGTSHVSCLFLSTNAHSVIAASISVITWQTTWKINYFQTNQYLHPGCSTVSETISVAQYNKQYSCGTEWSGVRATYTCLRNKQAATGWFSGILLRYAKLQKHWKMWIIKIINTKDDLPPSPYHAVQHPPTCSELYSDTCIFLCDPPASFVPDTSCKNINIKFIASSFSSNVKSILNIFQLI